MSEGWVKVYQADSRQMPEIANGEVDLVVTSPPYWRIKDYGVPGQIGYGQSLHAYLQDLYRVWMECYRVLKPGRRLCVNIGDQFARASVYGRYKVIPLHAEVIAQAEQIGFDYMGAIIWQKRTTMNTTGGATVMGSFPYPPNGVVEIDYEYILIFKKPGRSERIPKEVKERSRMSKEEWKQYFSGHWAFGGARQVEHEAMFPLELPHRLIRMFSFAGETVLDPFAGSGTTLEAAARLQRNAVGYEIAPQFVHLIEERLTPLISPMFGPRLEVQTHTAPRASLPESDYTPAIQDLRPRRSTTSRKKPLLYRVRSLEGEELVLESGVHVSLLGVKIKESQAFQSYARRYLLGKQVFLKGGEGNEASSKRVRAYVYLKNRIFVNAYLLKSGIAEATEEEHRLKARFWRWQAEGERVTVQGMGRD
jgi:DNA modification methylase